MEISVVIPCYNGERFLKEAIDSINQQTFKPKEIVIVNDGSKDCSKDIIEQLALSNSIPIVAVNQVNGGVSSARNIGIANAQYKWIAFLDVDDLWYPSKLKKQVEIVKSYGEDLGLICCDYHIDEKIDAKSKFSSSAQVGALKNRVLSQEEFQLAFIQENFVGTASTMLFKREIANKVGCFDVFYNHSEDFDFILRYACFARVYVSTDILVLKRHHGENLTGDLGLYYRSHAASLKKNFVLDSSYFRTNYPSSVYREMKLSYDDFLVKYCNHVYEKSLVEGVCAYLKYGFSIKTLPGLSRYLLSFAKKLIRTLSFNLIKKGEKQC